MNKDLDNKRYPFKATCGCINWILKRNFKKSTQQKCYCVTVAAWLLYGSDTWVDSKGAQVEYKKQK